MTQQKEATIGNAGAIIERFGGIRPMASKINVPVTTIQGWKKRNAIPAGRLDQILEAASRHSINISDIVNESTIANENQSFKIEPGKVDAGDGIRPFVNPFKQEIKQAESAKENARTSNVMPNVVYEDLVKNISEGEKKTMRKSLALNVICLLIAVGAIGLLLLPQSPNNQRIHDLESELQQLRSSVASAEQGQNKFAGLVPANLDEKISQFEQQAQNVGAEAVAATAELFGPSIDQFRNQVNTLAASPMFAGMIERFTNIKDSPDGEQKIADAWKRLSEDVAGSVGFDPNGQVELTGTIQNAREQDPSLGEVLAGIPPEDVKAGAMMFAMTQVRSLLGRDNVTFTKDLEALKSLAGNEDPELNDAIDRLAPQAQNGILSPDGLTNEFRGLAGDIVSASLTGEEISFTDRAKARLNNLVQVEKNGELVSGTPTQATVTHAQQQLEEGDLIGAISSVQSLDGSAAIAAQPWLQKANATLLAQQLKNSLTRSINMKTYGTGVTTMDAPLVQNPSAYYSPSRIVQ